MKPLTAADLKTLKPGKYRYGVEFFGCFNTGTDYAIYRPSNPYQRWVVAPSLEIIRILVQAMRNPKQRIFDATGNKKGYAFKGRAAAVKKWLELNNKQLQDNENMAKQAIELRKKANTHTSEGIGAILELADY